MAYVATTGPLPGHTNVFSRVKAALGGYLEQYIETRSHHAEIDALNRLTDDELAARGLTRDGILRYVFSGGFYL